jgi:hypothetical protein
MTPAARRRTAETPAPKSAKTAATPGGAERAQKAVARSRGVRLPSEQPSKRERLEQPILPLDDMEVPALDSHCSVQT